MNQHDEQYLWANIAIVEQEVKKGKITNVVGYLLKAFSDDYRPKETEHSKLEKAEKEKLLEDQKRVEEAEQMEKQLRKEFEIWKKQTTKERAVKLSEEELESLKYDFLESIKDNPIFSKIYETK